MAEFGLAAGVLQVAGFGAEVGSLIWRCARDIRDAKRDLESIAAEVEATARTLNSVGTLLSHPDTKALHTDQLLVDTEKVLSGCESVFNELHGPVQISLTKIKERRSWQSASTRLKWPVDKGRLTELKAMLERYRTVLHLMLTVLQIVETRQSTGGNGIDKLEAQLKDVLLSNKHLSDSNRSLTDTVAALVRGTTTQGANIQGSAGHTPDVSSSMVLMSVDHTDAALPNVKPPPRAVDSNTNKSLTTDVERAVRDQLQNCIDAVQGLEASLTSAMNAWNAQTTHVSGSVNGALQRVLQGVGQLPSRLRNCPGHDANYDPVSHGNCNCSYDAFETSKAIFKPCIHAVKSSQGVYAEDSQSSLGVTIDCAPPSVQANVNPCPSRSMLRDHLRCRTIQTRTGCASFAGSTPDVPSRALLGRPQPPTSDDLLAFHDDTSLIQRSSSPPRSARGRSTSDALDDRDYILDLANPERTPSNSAESRRQQKQPATFQCNLCPKRFTRAYNIRSHLRTHKDERPFTCTICGKAFARQHDRQRHEGLHSGENKFGCRGMLSSGSSWGCGRRFARVDGLAKHWRSEAGQICVKPLWDEQRSQAPFDVATPDTTGGFLPAALLQQYPALAGLDWNSLAQGPPPGEETYSGRSSLDATSGGETHEGLSGMGDFADYMDESEAPGQMQVLQDGVLPLHNRLGDHNPEPKRPLQPEHGKRYDPEDDDVTVDAVLQSDHSSDEEVCLRRSAHHKQVRRQDWQATERHSQDATAIARELAARWLKGYALPDSVAQ